MAKNDAPEPTVATLNDVAQAAGVSVASVSKVLNNRPGLSSHIRARVMKAIEETGYQKRGARQTPADGERLTILTLDQYLHEDYFYGEILRALLDECAEAGLRTDVALLPSDGRGTLGELPPDVLAAAPDLLVLLGVDRADVLNLAVSCRCPTIIVNGMDPRMRLDSISPDYHFGGWAATEHLLALGHRDIVHVTHPYRQSIMRRFDGFRDALQEFGVAFDPARHYIDLKTPRLVSVAGREAIEARLNAGPLNATAFFCVTDMIALGVIQALTARGIRVPEDVSVVGFDDLPVSSHATPPLTTMRIERVELGRKAIQMVLERAERPEATIRRLGMGVSLIARGSTQEVSG